MTPRVWSFSCEELLKQEPKMLGPSIVGFGG
jgi:hypothetical protein